MPTPMEYRLASQDFERFLQDAATESNLGSRHQAYTTVQAVLLCFRRRLSIQEAVFFAQILPPMLRALFIGDWDTNEPLSTSWDRHLMAKEVQQHRADHNFSPDTAIRDVAIVLRRHIDAGALERCLDKLPPPARNFWL